VRVADAGHVVVHVDVAAAVCAEEARPFAAHEVQRFVVEQLGAASEGAVPPCRRGSGPEFRRCGGTSHNRAR
jgi:hypothetical protein